MLNPDKLVHTVFILRMTKIIPIFLGNKSHTQIRFSQVHLRMHLNSKLNWNAHVKMKREQMKLKMRTLTWLLDRHSPLDLHSKRLLYFSTAYLDLWLPIMGLCQ